MQRLTKILLLVTLLGIAAASLGNGRLNVVFRNVLDGSTRLSTGLAREIYNSYQSSQEKTDYRFQIFMATLEEIRTHNRGTFTWRQGINDFSDLTFEEFSAQRLMKPQDCSATSSLKIKNPSVSIPDSYEWNNFGLVSPVKNQASCGSCWAFSTVGSLESHWKILGLGREVTFSEQQLVDCAGDFDNHGCQGGLPSHAFEYIKYAEGIESDVTYPYFAKNMQCVFRKNIAVGYVRYGSYNITEGNEVELAERLYSAGPIAVSFQVVSDFRNYVSGVYSTVGCGTTTKDINHAVLATGYGTENGVKFFNIKNSWGAAWGAQGYFKIKRDVNMCAISQCNSYPLINRMDGFEAV